MEQGKFCDGCSQADDCKIIYEQLGRAEGPPVAFNAIVTFVVPILVFVGALGGFDMLLRDRVAPSHQTLLAFILALGITVAAVLAISAIVKRVHKSR